MTQDKPQPTSFEEASDIASEGEVFSLLDLVLVLLRNRKLIVYVAGLFFIIGLGIIILSSPRYTATASLIRETQSETSSLGGIASLGEGLGLNLDTPDKGLTADAYPDIIRSREVRLSVARDSISQEGSEDSVTFTEYYHQHRSFFSRVVAGILKYTIGLPGVIRDSVGGTQDTPVARLDGKGYRYPTEAEEEAIRALSEMLSVKINPTSGVMQVSVISSSSLLSAQLAESFVNNLTDRVRAIRTRKARENLEFVRERFQEARAELRAAEDTLAAFLDRNQNIQSAQLQTERERLQRQVRFKSQLYSNLQTQVTQAELDLQRSIPVITMLERPVPPMHDSGPGALFILAGTTLFGVIVGILGAFVRTFFQRVDEDAEESRKMQELKESVGPLLWWKREGEQSSRDV